jgi:hypothetical protein
VVVAIEAFDAVAVRGAKVFEAAVFERMIDVKAPIVRAIVAVPMVIVNVWSGIDVPGRMAFGFRPGARFAARGRPLGNASMVCSRGILAPLSLLAALLARLCQDRESRE